VEAANHLPYRNLHYDYLAPQQASRRTLWSVERGASLEVEHFGDGVSERLLPLPFPRTFEPSVDAHWIGNYTIAGWSVPRRQSVAPLILRDYAPGIAEQVRITRGGFALSHGEH